MGRQRRFCGALAVVPNTPSSYAFGVPSALEQAISLHRSGRRSEARKLYERCTKQPAVAADAMHLLGVLAHEEGKTKAGIQWVRRAIKKRGKHPEYLNSLGELLRASGQLKEAKRQLEAALAKKPGYLAARFNLGRTLSALGDGAGAEAAWREVLRLDPSMMAARRELIRAAALAGCFEAAGEMLREAVRLDPENDELLTELGHVEHRCGRVAPAILHFQAALRVRPENAVARAHLLDALENAELQSADPWWAEFLTDAFLDGEVEHRKLWVPAMGVLQSQGAQLMTAVTEESCRAWSENRLLLAMLSAVKVSDPTVEDWLRRMRDFAFQSPGDVPISLRIAVADQFLHTDYLYPVPPETRVAFDDRRATVRSYFEGGREAADEETRATIFGALSLLAMVEPLVDRLPEKALSSGLSEAVSPGFQRFLERHLFSPRAVAKVCARRGRARAIDEDGEEDVTNRVRAQYEAHPFPRYASVPRRAPQALETSLRAECPGLDALPATIDRPRVLVAGCGTGRHPIALALAHPDAEVWAIDLSFASIAYAEHRAETIGVPNLRFAQANLLRLDASAGDFDLIECVGVLHHLAAPEEGWAVLRQRLRPRGIMRVGLYSRLARRGVAAVRAYLEENGIGASPDEMRTFREALMHDAKFEALREGVAHFWDLYNLNELRDLLFHAHEESTSLPEIAALLERQSLRFLGFTALSERTRAQFAKWSEAREEAPSALAAWNAFEETHPDCFSGMYQFFVQDVR